MCGICYVKRVDGKRASHMVAKRFHKQKHRGKEGFGYISIDDGFITAYERSALEDTILEKLEQESANEIIFHHRMPTSTPNFKECAHPIKVSHASLKHDYYLIHNGVIYNDEELRTKHLALGFAYTTEVRNEWKNADKTLSETFQFNDSECLAIELARDLDNGQTGIEARGSIAFIMIQTDKKTNEAKNLFFGRNSSSPLILDIDQKHYLALTSEGSGTPIEEDKLFIYNYKDNVIDTKDYKLGAYVLKYDYRKDDAPSAYDEYGEGYEYKNGKYTYVGRSSKKIGFTEKEEDWIKYYENIEELEDFKDRLKEAYDSQDEDEVWYCETRIMELEAEIKAADDNAATKLLEQPNA